MTLSAVAIISAGISLATVRWSASSVLKGTEGKLSIINDAFMMCREALFLE